MATYPDELPCSRCTTVYPREHYYTNGKGRIIRTCRPCRNAVTKAGKRATRDEVLAHYGGKCVCCGETQRVFLTLDHVDGNGNADRRTRNNPDLAWWLKKQGFPPGFQVMCWNCNAAKHILGACPH